MAKEGKTVGEGPQNQDRRRFLKSLFGVGSALESSSEAKAAPKAKGELFAFYWADLARGNIGFPSGLSVPVTRPGSVMKIVTAACLLEEGAFNPNDTIECRGSTKVAGAIYKCQRPHGNLTIEKALGFSCNCFFVKATRQVGPLSIVEYARLFGLDKPVVGFKPGSFPTKAISETADYALGLSEDLQTNALQLLRLSAIIALQGHIPALRNAGMCEEGDKPFSVELKASTFERIKRGMILAAQEGTADGIDPEGRLRIAAKTGTVPHGKKFESWVTGFFPHEKPRHAFCLFARAGTSHDSAVPEAKKQLYRVEWPTT